MKYIILVATVLATLFSATEAGCLAGWTEWNGHCYRYMSQVRLNWNNANAACKAESPEENGHLVTIDSADENKFVHDWWVSMLSPLLGIKWQYIWTGLNDIEVEGTFVWNDGSPVTYTNWGGQQPDNRDGNSNCATMVTRYADDLGKWDDAKCFGWRAYVCEYTL